MFSTGLVDLKDINKLKEFEIPAEKIQLDKSIYYSRYTDIFEAKFDNQPVAIKRYKPYKKDVEDWFQSEALAMSQLNSPYLVQCNQTREGD